MYTHGSHGHICHFKQPKNPAESSAFSPQVLLPSNIRFNHMTSMFEFVRCCCAVSTTHIGKKGCGEATTGKSLRFRREFSRSRSRAKRGWTAGGFCGKCQVVTTWILSGVTVYIYYTYMVWYNILFVCILSYCPLLAVVVVVVVVVVVAAGVRALISMVSRRSHLATAKTTRKPRESVGPLGSGGSNNPTLWAFRVFVSTPEGEVVVVENHSK